jgi:hypothetical protein
MRRLFARRGTGLLAVAALAVALLHPAPSWAADEPAPAQWLQIANKTFDVLVLRPAGVVMALSGAALFVPAALLASPGGKAPVTVAYEHFVSVPFDNAFMRPIGDF